MSVIMDVFLVSPTVQDNPSALRPPEKFNWLEKPVTRMLEEISTTDRTDEIITITSCYCDFASLTKEVK